MSQNWRLTEISSDMTHHVINDKPLYKQKFLSVLKYHHPGIAPVVDITGSYHIDIIGNQIYQKRYDRTFGFYFERAAVKDNNNWYHILVDGTKAYEENYAWVGNYQNNLCVVRDFGNRYFHIDLNGNRVYNEEYAYAGDFRDGIAVIIDKEKGSTHINIDGRLTHGKYFKDLDVYHKGFARARDDNGWFHINIQGDPIYNTRFRMVEPFYNGYSFCENMKGIKCIVDESGTEVLQLKQQN